MKTQQFLQSLSQQLRQWQRQYKILFREGKCQHKLHRNFFNHLLLYLSAHSHQGKQGKRGQTQKSTAKLVRKTSGIDKVIFRWVHQKRSSIILVLAILSLTSVVGNNLYNQPRMKVDNIALQTFIAPYSDNIEDRQETEQQRQNAIDRSAPIFPFADTSRLSTSTQRYLRTFPESEWQQLKGTLGNNRKQNLKKQNSKLLLLPQSSINSKKLSSSSNFPVLPLPSYGNYSDEASFIQALSELEADQFTASASDFSELITQISQVRQGYNQAIKKASQLETGQVKKIYIERSNLIYLSYTYLSK